jgi:hypothetical protein
MATELAAQIATLSWSKFNEFSLLGDLSKFIHLVGDPAKRKSMQQLASISASNASRRERAPASLWVCVGLKVPEGESPAVSCSKVATFYGNFFEPSVSNDATKNFIRDLIIVRRKYYKPTTYSLHIIAALTFSRQWKNIAPYLAFTAVSDGQQKTPSLSDKKVHNLPVGPFPHDHTGYQGFGLGSMLISLMGQLVASSVISPTLPSLCFLHYNSDNEASAPGWLKLGFHSFTAPSQSLVNSNAAVRAQYTAMAAALASCSLFKASHDASGNCTALFMKFPNVLPPLPSNEPVLDSNSRSNTSLVKSDLFNRP